MYSFSLKARYYGRGGSLGMMAQIEGMGEWTEVRLRHRKVIRLDSQGYDKIMGFSWHGGYRYKRGSEF